MSIYLVEAAAEQRFVHLRRVTLIFLRALSGRKTATIGEDLNPLEALFNPRLLGATFEPVGFTLRRSRSSSQKRPHFCILIQAKALFEGF